MHCRNCGNEVSDKAVACPKCGVDPRTEKNFCPSCGIDTKPNQAVCVKCGVSLAGKSFSFDASSLKNIEINSAVKNPALIAPAIALIACFLPWLKMNLGGGIVDVGISPSFSMFNLSTPLMIADTILAPGLLYFLPICLIGIIAADFVPQITPYKKYFYAVSALLIVYAAIGLYQVVNPSAPEVQTGRNSYMNRLAMLEIYKIGWGFYVAATATAASVFFSGLFTKKQQ